jgi:hypothetical protein
MLLRGNDIYFAGTTHSIAPIASLLLVRMNLDGELDWVKRWVGAGTCSSPRLAYRSTYLGDTLYLAFAVQVPEKKLVVARFNTNGTQIDQSDLEIANIDVEPVDIEVFFNRFTFATKVYIVSRYSSSTDQLLLTAFDGEYTPVFERTWRLNSNIYPTGLLLDSAGGLTVTGHGPGLSPGTTLAYLCRFNRDDGTPIATQYYEVTDDASRLYCAADFHGGLLVAGYAPHAAGSWQDISGHSGTLSYEWSGVSGSGGIEPLILSRYYTEPEEAPAGVIDTGAGSDDAFLAYRDMPE